jgi:hypothetical protein
MVPAIAGKPMIALGCYASPPTALPFHRDQIPTAAYAEIGT